MKNGSRVHCVTLDAAKAFDKVLHSGLFYKMISKGVSTVFLLKYLCIGTVTYKVQYCGIQSLVNVLKF